MRPFRNPPNVTIASTTSCIGKFPSQTKSPAGAGLSSELDQLLLAAGEAETGEADAEERKGGRFGDAVFD